MDYSDAYLREFLPGVDPPAASVSEDVDDEIRVWIERSRLDDPALIARSTRWTYALFGELRQRQVRLQGNLFLPGWDGLLSQTAIGLYDHASEQAGFGLVLSGLPSDGPDFQIIDTVEFPRLGVKFPLALRRAEFEPHAPVHPKGATATAWARCNATSLWGILTAGHAVRGNRPGRAVPLAGGGWGSLVRSHHPPIDAAFVHVASNPVGLAPLPFRSFPAAGQPVELDCRSGALRRTVVEAMDALGVVNTRYFAVLLFVDEPGSPGDSGALVRAASGEAVGLYTASLKNSKTPTGFAGVVQHFEQAALALDITAFT